MTQRLSTVALTIIVTALMFFTAFMAAGALPVQDLAQYWSAAHLVKQNPYSPELVSQFQRAHGIQVDPPLVLKNPPWTIPSFLLLGIFSYRIAFAFWTLLSLIILLGCTHAIWRELNTGASRTPILLPLLFGPAVVQLMLGQWTILVLLGISVFLIAIERRQDWIAGASLVLVLGKPHVALLFLLAVVIWTIRQRRWRVLVFASIALFSMSLAIQLLNPHIWSQFLVRTSEVVHETEAYPNLGGMLYLVTGNHSLGILPQLGGVIWLIFYFRKHAYDWNWWKHGSMVILCSVVVSYYSYPYDEILALPALLVAFANAGVHRRRFLIPFIATNLGYLLYISNVAGRFGYGYMFLFWTASGWLATRLSSLPPKAAQSELLP
ncbi:MAG: DUF2029 domain-containing protein [Acidobacteria bacterium]|nr:DUF2029 domain-containing protein [Acidobacteriota bacterium]